MGVTPRDEQSLEKIQEHIVDVGTIEAEQVIKPTLDELKKYADDFLNAVNVTEVKIQNIENLLSRQKALRAGLDKKKYSKIAEYQTNQKNIKELMNDGEVLGLYAQAELFQTKLNNFLGQNFVMIFVWVKKGVPTLYRINNTNVLKIDSSSSGKVVARYHANKTMLDNALTKITFDDSDQQGLANLQSAYQAVVTRREKHEKTMRAMWHNPYSNTPKWHVGKIQEIGDVNEAYANIILTRQEKLFAQTSDLDTNIEIFMVLFWSQVSNESGALTGDVEYGNIEYGIKSARATMLSLQQLKVLANKIKDGTIKTAENLQQEKENMKKKAVTRNQIYEDEDMAVTASLSELENNLNMIPGITAHLT